MKVQRKKYVEELTMNQKSRQAMDRQDHLVLYLKPRIKNEKEAAKKRLTKISKATYVKFN